MRNHLFYLSTKINYGSPGSTGSGDKFKTRAPIAIPYHAGENHFPATLKDKREKIINISKEFKWTRTLKEGRKDVPNIILTERSIQKSSTLSNILYLLYTGLDFGANNFLNLTDVLGEVIGGDFANITNEIGKDGANIVDSVQNWIIRKSNSEKRKFDPHSFGERLIKGDPISNENTYNYLRHYNALYLTTPTAFKYIFPYLENDWKKTQSEWSEATLFNLLESALFGLPGIFSEGFNIESAKSYNYPKHTTSFKFTFQLDNTLDLNFDNEFDASWQKNWQLMYLLCYQNLPNRESRYYAYPSHLYQVDISGLEYHPYCYISNLQVKMLGNRKEKDVEFLLQDIDISIPPGKRFTKTLIPEVYEIDIELKSMIPESQNLYFHSINNSVVTSEEE